jgi:hypothetical protein
MLVEFVPLQPYPDAIWIGGYWVWEGNWIWGHGRWAPPPRPGYRWCNPYYEHRGDSVVFVNGFWAAPGVVFERPSPSINIALAVVAVGIVAGPRPIGPEGVFVPPPPGSRYGLIVPAPVGTAPAVVVSAPPVINEGMRIHVNTTIVNNITNAANVTNVTVVAPASATANGQAVNRSVPAQAHLAAALPAVAGARAPEPASSKAIPAYVAGRAPVALPPAQAVHPEAPPSQVHVRVPEPVHPGMPPSLPAAVTRPSAELVAAPSRERNEARPPVVTPAPAVQNQMRQGNIPKALPAPRDQSQQQDKRMRAEQKAAAMNPPMPQSRQGVTAPHREKMQPPVQQARKPTAEPARNRDAKKPKQEER